MNSLQDHKPYAEALDRLRQLEDQKQQLQTELAQAQRRPNLEHDVAAVLEGQSMIDRYYRRSSPELEEMQHKSERAPEPFLTLGLS